MFNTINANMLTKGPKVLQYLSIFFKKNILSYIFGLSVVIICTLIGFIASPLLSHSNLIMIYLLGVVVVTTTVREKRGPSILAALLSIFVFDFFFITPYYSFGVSDLQYFITLMVMLFITQLISRLTIRVQAHTEAIQKAKIQNETERLRNILLASISHDLRTPLTAIIGSSSTLMQSSNELDQNTKLDLIKNIYDEAKRLNRMVNNVLQMIRSESRSIKIKKQRYAFEDIISAALEIFSEQITSKALSIKVTSSEFLPLIPLDPHLIEQVLSNLIENAIKYTSDGSEILLATQMTIKNFIFKIYDCGPGIDPNEINIIFDKFYQGNESSNDSGFGLGLAICKNIISAHGGKIWAENCNSGGAIFGFSLPING